MATNKSIITQAALEPIKAWEAEIAENLIFHANTSLSKAHGWEFAGASPYQDSYGDQVGSAQMRLSFNNINYYAPLNASTEPGQPPITGIEFSASAAQGQGGSAWVTDFSTESQAHLIATNTQLLLPHTLRSHWEAHTGGVYTIKPQPVSDSAGHLVGSHVAVIVYKGQQLLIPCDTHYGGPLQPPRNLVLTCDTPFVDISEGSSNDCNVKLFATGLGTQPFTYKFQVSINNADPWADVVIPLTTILGWQPGFISTITGNLLNIINVGPGSESTAFVYIRCLVSNVAGIGATNSIYFGAHDATGSWIVYAAHAVAPFSKSEMLRLYRLRLWSLKNHNADTAVYMGRTGNQLVTRMKAQGYDFAKLTPEIQGFLGGEMPYEERFARFKAMVLHCFAEYWPSCPDPLVKDGLNSHQVNRT